MSQENTALRAQIGQARGQLQELAHALRAVDGELDEQAAQIALVLGGKQGTAMASFARLTDSELAAVITYTRTAWGNKAGEVQPAEVKAARKG